MWRFVLRENIRRFSGQLADEKSPERREVLRDLLTQAQAELAELEGSSTPDFAQGNTALQLFADQAIDKAMELHQAQFGVLQVYDEPLGSLALLAQKNFRAEFLRPFAFIKIDDEASIAARCFREGNTIVVEDVARDGSFEARRDTAREGNFAAVQSSPVRNSHGTLIGVLSTHFTLAQHFSEPDIRRMDQFAKSIGEELQKRMQTCTSKNELRNE